MSYLSFARKYRPQNFSDLVGQEATARVLANAIALGREPTGVIFSGIRGIGKTTAARIYAKALNCEQRDAQADPCGTCSSCIAIANDTHEDVCELDGASHNGVDEIRALQETVVYAPQRSRYKVYIIDEVHMLSTSAFNALLKTLEEPPKHVVFILATTELQKIPDTVIGRCQTFHLKKISLVDMNQRIQQILEAEKIPFDPAVIPMISKQGLGSMRDALTFLDQAVALGNGALRLAELEETLGFVRESTVTQLLSALIKRDPKSCMQAIDQVDSDGIEFDELTESLATMARNGFIAAGLKIQNYQDAIAHRLDISESAFKVLSDIATHAHPLDFNRLFRVLVQCRKDQDGSGQDRFVFENCCFEWCFDPGLPSLESLRPSGKTPRVQAVPQAAGSQSAASAAGVQKPVPTPYDLKRSHEPAQAEKAPTRPRTSLTEAFKSFSQTEVPTPPSSGPRSDLEKKNFRI